MTDDIESQLRNAGDPKLWKVDGWADPMGRVTAARGRRERTRRAFTAVAVAATVGAVVVAGVSLGSHNSSAELAGGPGVQSTTPTVSVSASSTASTPAVTTSASTPAVTTSASTSPTPTPSSSLPTAAANRACTVKELTYSEGSAEHLGMGTNSQFHLLSNNSQIACSLRGFPRISAKSRGTGKAISASVSETVDAATVGSPLAVQLPSDGVVLNPGDAAGFYVVTVSGDMTGKSCNVEPSDISYKLPGGSDIVLSDQPFCDGIQLFVSPFISAPSSFNPFASS